MHRPIIYDILPRSFCTVSWCYLLKTYFMKKEASLLFFLVVTLIHVNAQAPQHKSHLEISIGPSFPVSHFAQDNINSSSSGFAKTGQAGNISYSRLIGKRLGVAASLRGQRNPLNVHSMEEEFSKFEIPQGLWTVSNPGQPLPPLPTTTYPNWKFDKQSWLLGSLLVGAYGEFPTGNKKTSFIAKALIGAIYADVPGAEGMSITDTATASFVQTETHGFGFTYSVDAGFQFDISERLSLLTTLEYMGTNNVRFDAATATFTTTHGTPGTPEYGVSQSSVRGELRQIISSINLLVGIALRL